MRIFATCIRVGIDACPLFVSWDRLSCWWLEVCSSTARVRHLDIPARSHRSHALCTLPLQEPLGAIDGLSRMIASTNHCMFSVSLEVERQFGGGYMVYGILLSIALIGCECDFSCLMIWLLEDFCGDLNSVLVLKYSLPLQIHEVLLLSL